MGERKGFWEETMSSVKERFHPEYTPLEALIACLIDGMAPRTDNGSRKQRVRQANLAITGQDIDRLDEPDSNITRALYEMSRRQEANYLTGLKPEYGGLDEPERDYEADLCLAIEVCKELGLDSDNYGEKLRKRYAGTYWRKLTTEERNLARWIPSLIYSDFDATKEAQLLSDFREIDKILSKHGIRMQFETVFWRTIGNDPKSVTKITDDP